MALNKKSLKIDYEPDPTVFGIVTPIKDYRLGHFINKSLRVAFTKAGDLEITSQTFGTRYFSKYHYRTEQGTDAYLIKNKGTEGFWVNELKEMDFFLAWPDAMELAESEDILVRLNMISTVQKAYLIDTKKLMSKKSFSFL